MKKEREAVEVKCKDAEQEKDQLKKELKELQATFDAQNKELEELQAGFAAEKELEEDCQKQVDDMFFGYQCCLKKNDNSQDIPNYPSNEKDATISGPA